MQKLSTCKCKSSDLIVMIALRGSIVQCNNLGGVYLTDFNVQGRGCGFLKWRDDEMGERVKEVINKLMGHVENLNDRNVGLRRMDEGGLAGYIEDDIATIYANMRKNERRLKQAFCALFMTWFFCSVLLLH